MKTSHSLIILALVLFPLTGVLSQDSRIYIQEKVFPLVSEHTHGSTIVELPNGDLLAAWFQGSGERWADDVRIMGARMLKGKDVWGKPFEMADEPGFPDINPVLFLDPEERLWLVWYVVIANQWSTSLPMIRTSENYMQKEGPPEWKWQQVLFVKPGDKAERGIVPKDRFVLSVARQADAYKEYAKKIMGDNEKIMAIWEKWREDILWKARGNDMLRDGYYLDANGRRIKGKRGYPYFRRMGWQTKNKAVFLDDGRLILPLYSDGFSFSLMAITDDLGKHWKFSEPLVAPGNIQPTIAIRRDGTLVTYMRDNGPPPKRLMVSESKDKGLTWSNVRDSELPNEGSGADIVTLKNGHWVLAYNDTEEGRNSLAVSLSEDEGKTWAYTRHLELDKRDLKIATKSSYPSIIEGKGGVIHVIYSFHRNDTKGAPSETIKYARIDEDWIKAGD